MEKNADKIDAEQTETSQPEKNIDSQSLQSDAEEKTAKASKISYQRLVPNLIDVSRAFESKKIPLKRKNESKKLE
ncbi:hypothetical protein [Deinococcus soli (ex Cha et al. 2016)]|uniref:hypothetical protein n=1 Tax=Deinococcus soli (ex Cha et al. 2016) TaxID=1309411 RepID=UPI00166692B7|nr:hypothetical protein [Deinococcus soli (ex Cha et al. 2016)]GGB76539.1 hypothetical protein GCM10008019_35940 [Deinococcus soli (ex Cha et al. 2016)]